MAAIPTQDHIHLSSTLGGTPEFAPNIKWTILDRRVVPVVFLNPKRGLKASLYPNVLKNGSTPVVVRNFKYTIKVQDDYGDVVDDRVETLIGLYGKTIYLCDSKHANDGSDHTSYVRTVLLSEIGEFKADHKGGLSFYYVDVSLEDASL